jgi:hypothetical protein
LNLPAPSLIFTQSLHSLYAIFNINGYHITESKEKQHMATTNQEVSKMKNLFVLTMMLILTLTGCQKANSSQQAAKDNMTREEKTLQLATFSGGCFWCTEAVFTQLKGVEKVESG